jgi:8-oxo-dGTP pyrophosphatase MutT (NUDIX family)
MKKSYRAGAIIVNLKSQIALVNEHLWGFSRGGVKKGEEYLEAAKREVLEETGLNDFISIQSLGGYERYPHGIDENTPGAYPMEIHMWLFRVNDTQVLKPKNSKVKDFGWYSLKEAYKILQNKNDKDFLRKHEGLIFNT